MGISRRRKGGQMLSCPPSRCCKPWMERLLPPPACRTARLGERSCVPVLVGRRHVNNGRYPFVCACTSSSSSSPSPLPRPSPILSVTGTTTTTTTTAPVISSGATVVSTTTTTISAPAGSTSPIVKKRKRYRKAYPGESKGIVEEMRFVAMRLRNGSKDGEVASGGGEDGSYGEEDVGEGKEKETWQPSMEGFLRYLVDSKLIFETIERTVDQSEDVAYAYFRKTGLERSNSLSKDLDWFSNQGVTIPNPSTPGTTYAAYLSELAESSAPSFLCHTYNIYFAHATGGQAIGKQVQRELLSDILLVYYLSAVLHDCN
ncbi:hypothetical protein Taro_003784 [Colocasia esculenta]|uniref:Inactive heme oxygenase 2, chloroplastic n=1 Tax=Colocasia esculenta TaxID=4460 RepID=A0A843TKC0_COLES|nr:hypothetical protein [Colocasia esculenta]